MLQAYTITEIADTLGTTADKIIRDTQAVGIREDLTGVIICSIIFVISLIFCVKNFSQSRNHDAEDWNDHYCTGLLWFIPTSITGIIVPALAVEIYSWVTNPISMTLSRLLG